jgi:hypothetical protein
VTPKTSDIPRSDWTGVQLKKLSPQATRYLKDYVSRIGAVSKAEPADAVLNEIEFLQRTALRSNPLNRSNGQGNLNSLICVISDLAKQGWLFRYQATLEYQKLLPTQAADKDLAQSLKQVSSFAARYNNLLQPNIQDRIRTLESNRFFQQRPISIFSLMRDGRELSEGLQTWTKSSTSDLREVIDPYIQVAKAGVKCAYTGLDLMDVWWYFRQTWGIPHESTAGRSLPFLIRDRATENHAVIGITALSSPIAQHSVRDEFIGWDTNQVLTYLHENPSARLCRWINDALSAEFSLVYKSDFISDKTISTRSVRHPTLDVIQTLQVLSAHEKKLHQGSAHQSKARNKTTDFENRKTWEYEASTHLFRAKRALLLSQLLSYRLALNEFGLHKNTKSALRQALDSTKGRNAIGRIIRLQKERTVGTAIAEIAVCGSIQPYSTILGGKLVSLLMIGPEILNAYKKRYSGHVNVIASSMAGKVIRKPADLVFLSTTSLYGRPNQYTRASIPLNEISNTPRNDVIKFHYLGKTAGKGTLQFSKNTLQYFRQAQKDAGEAITVKGQFGEGGSEKLRYIRQRLAALGFDPEDLLEHGVPRSYYGIKFIKNTRNYLLGIDKIPQYFIPRRATKSSTVRIVNWWANRWLKKRLARSDSKELHETLCSHNLIMPIRHGARIVLPKTDVEQSEIFPELNSN